MATGAVIGALRVVIGADTAALDKGLKDAQGALASFGRRVSEVAAGVGLERAIEKSVQFLVSGIKHAVQAADEMGKAAQKIGLPVEELSALKHAADLADVSFETLQKSLVQFDKQLAQAAAGGTNDLTKALEAMGIEIKNADGSLKTQSELIGEVADKFKSYEDGAAKTNLSLALFKKSGAELVPLLNAGRDGLKEAADEARRFGLIIDTQTAKQSEAFNDNMRRLGAVLQGLAIQLISKGGIAEGLSSISTGLINASQQTEGFKAIAEGFGTVLRVVAEEIAVFAVGIGRLGAEFAAFRRLMAAPFFTQEFSDAWTNFTKTGEETSRIIKEVRFGFQQGGDAAVQFAMDVGTLAAAATKAQPPLVNLGETSKNALQSFIDSTQRANEARRIELETAGKSAGAAEELRVRRQGELIATQNRITISPEMRKALDNEAAAAGSLARGIEGTNLRLQNLDPQIRFREEMEKTRQQMLAVGATSEEIARAQEQVAERFGQAWSNIGGSIAGTLGQISSLTKSLGKENKALGLLSKAFGIGQAIINTQIAVTKALATLGPTPAGFAAAALAVATGAAAVATIASQGFAQGGSFRIPGGTSLTDDQMVPLSLAAGERVDITPAASAAGTTINIDLGGGDGFYTRSNIERLLDAMHTVLADGHNVRLAVVK